MKRLLLSFLPLPLLLSATLLPGTATYAAPIVHPVLQSQAQGLTGGGSQIVVWSGSGTNIDFNRTGETILRAWLDDPSQVAVDFDGSLGQRASVVHLRRLIGIKFPNLPQAGSTLLTVITQSPYGKKTYLFQVTYGSGKAQYASVIITPDNQPLDGGGVVVSGNRTSNWSDVERGLQQAISQRLLAASSPVVKRVRSFLSLVRNGVPMQQAALQTHVSLEVVSKLAEMGYAAIPSATPAPIPPTATF